MVQDARLIFFEDQALARTTAEGATQVGDIIYLGHAHDLGPGTVIPITIRITAAAVGVGGSLEFELEVANEVAFATTNEVVWASGPIAVATLVKGHKIPGCQFVNKGKTYARFLTTATDANITAGTGTAVVETKAQEAGEPGTITTP